ncbi:MAG: hypothetical protein E6Q76_05290 [Rhizobium sp.]|nr:MAG: hypothetical protein E6Q76_05290 [Rhizobium sp.]
MSGERLRQPIKSDYTEALGSAAFCFAICEWNAVYCAERISPGALDKIVQEELTAGKIAKKLVNLVRNMPASKNKAELMAAAKAFADIVPLRNNILHGKPCTGPNGEARLSGSTVIENADLKNAADTFSVCSIELNRLLHGFLATYAPTHRARGAHPTRQRRLRRQH